MQDQETQSCTHHFILESAEESLEAGCVDKDGELYGLGTCVKCGAEKKHKNHVAGYVNWSAAKGFAASTPEDVVLEE